jgi:hypothetical protein
MKRLSAAAFSIPALFALLFAASPAAAQGGGACPAGMTATTSAEMYFGRYIGMKPEVSERAWRRFVDLEVAPRFPSGFSMHDVTGQYRGAGGQSLREPSKVLSIILDPADAAAAARLKDIAEAYKQRFKQESVLTVLRPACASF